MGVFIDVTPRAGQGFSVEIPREEPPLALFALTASPAGAIRDQTMQRMAPPPQGTSAARDPTRPEQVARTSHQVSTAADDASYPAVFSHQGVLNVLQSTPARPLVRKPAWPRRLIALVTKPGEKYGLGSRCLGGAGGKSEIRNPKSEMIDG